LEVHEIFSPLEIYADEVDEGNIITGQASQHGQGVDCKDDVHVDVGCATSHHQLDTPVSGKKRMWAGKAGEPAVVDHPSHSLLRKDIAP
jgi:hypothetical protein